MSNYVYTQMSIKELVIQSTNFYVGCNMQQ